MLTLATASQEMLERRAARAGLLAYVLYNSPKYKRSAFSQRVCEALDQFLYDMEAGRRPILILQAPPQHGKLLEDSTPVLTVDGWKTHGELVAGDFVFAPEGSITRVVAVSSKAEANCRIELTDGSIFYCHENHEWLVRSRDLKRECVLSARQMMNLGRRSVRSNALVASGTEGARGSRFNYQLPHVSPLQGATSEFPVAPYTLGAWLGDGTRVKPQISSDWKDIEVANGIVADGYPIMGLRSHPKTGILSISFKGLWQDLKKAEVTSKPKQWKSKFIPDQYLIAPIEARLQLLAGLIDTDGYVYQKNGRVVFTTAERSLADSVAQLVATFGWRATIGKELAKLSSSGIQGIKDYWVVGFNPDMQIPCRLRRKQITVLSKKRRIAIKSIEFGDWGKQGHCVQVDRADGMYLVGHSLIPTHNSELVSRKLPAYIMGRFPHWRIGTASYSSELAHAMAQDVRRNLSSNEHSRLFPVPGIKRKYDINRMGEFTSPGGTGSYLAVGVGSGLTGRPVDIGIIDDPIKDQQEALSDVTKESHWNWYQTVFTTRLSENSGQIIMATSWAEDDLPARIASHFKGDRRLTVLQFPAINEPGETGYDPHLPLGALVPALHSLMKLREVKSLLSDYWWSALYQQNPQPVGGNVFKKTNARGLSCIQYWLPKDIPIKFDLVIDSWDCTFKDTDGTDYVVGGKWGLKGSQSFLLYQFRDHMSFTATCDKVKELHELDPVSQEVLIEDKANGPAVIDFLKKIVWGLIAVEPDGSKLARAHAVTGVWEAQNVFLPHPDIAASRFRTLAGADKHGTKTLEGELLKFPAAAHDDQVDMFTQALRRLYPLFGRLKISGVALKEASRKLIRR